MRFWVYLLLILYVLSPYDFFPDFFIGRGWIDDLIILGLLWWYHFHYRGKKYTQQQRDQRYRQSAKGDERRFKEDGSFKAGAGSEAKTKDKDPYDVLGIKKDATVEEIKVAYRRLANQYHPDKVTHLGDEFRLLAEKRFKEIQDAYRELTAHR